MSKVILALFIALIFCSIGVTAKNKIVMNDIKLRAILALAAATDDHICTLDEKDAFTCPFLFKPVCGDNNKLYNNGCEACRIREVTSYTVGACP